MDEKCSPLVLAKMFFNWPTLASLILDAVKPNAELRYHAPICRSSIIFILLAPANHNLFEMYRQAIITFRFAPKYKCKFSLLAGTIMKRRIRGLNRSANSPMAAER